MGNFWVGIRVVGFRVKLVIKAKRPMMDTIQRLLLVYISTSRAWGVGFPCSPKP